MPVAPTFTSSVHSFMVFWASIQTNSNFFSYLIFNETVVQFLIIPFKYCACDKPIAGGEYKDEHKHPGSFNRSASISRG